MTLSPNDIFARPLDVENTRAWNSFFIPNLETVSFRPVSVCDHYLRSAWVLHGARGILREQ
jgi:hypothetical protein